MHVAVIGGGITGLAAAWFLRTAHEAEARAADRADREGAPPEVGPPKVTVFEASSRLGGKLRTIELAGLPVDVGAEAMLRRRPEAVELARAVGLEDDLRFPHTTSAGLWTGEALRPVPAGTQMGIPADLSPVADSGVLSAEGLARAARDLELPAPGLDGDVAIGAYAGERLGPEVVDRLIEPLLGGVYAGRAGELSLQATVPQLAPYLKEDGSLIRAAARLKAAADRRAPAPGKLPVFAGLDGGIGRLPEAVAARSGARIRHDTVRALARASDGWELVVGPTPRAETVRADAVIIACPARPASRLLSEVAPFAAAELASIEYASLATIAFAFDRSAFAAPLDGSGFLVPPGEGTTIKAATYSSVKWDWLAARDPRLVVVRCSVGRHRGEAELHRDDEDLAELALADLQRVVGPTGRPVDVRVTRWGGALPQYAVGHRDLVARVRKAVAAHPGLAVAGAAFDGVGIPACIATAEAAAEDVLRHVRMAA